MTWWVALLVVWAHGQSAETVITQDDNQLEILYTSSLKDLKEATDQRLRPAELKPLLLKELDIRVKLRDIYEREKLNPKSTNKELLTRKFTTSQIRVVDMCSQLLKMSLTLPQTGTIILYQSQGYADIDQNDQAVRGFELLLTKFKTSVDLTIAALLLHGLNTKLKRWEPDYKILSQIPLDPHHFRYLDILEALYEDSKHLNQSARALFYLEKIIAKLTADPKNATDKDGKLTSVIDSWAEINAGLLGKITVPEIVRQMTQVLETDHALLWLERGLRGVFSIFAVNRNLAAQLELLTQVRTLPIPLKDKLNIWLIGLDQFISHNDVIYTTKVLGLALTAFKNSTSSQIRELDSSTSSKFFRFQQQFNQKVNRLSARELQKNPTINTIHAQFSSIAVLLAENGSHLDPEIEFNLAEDLAQNKQFSEAIHRYSNVIKVAHETKKPNLEQKAQLRRIVAMYSFLLKHNIISLSHNHDINSHENANLSTPREVEERDALKQFIESVEANAALLKNQHEETYLFEACRLRLQTPELQEPSDKANKNNCMDDFITHFPQSLLVEPAVVVVIDGYLKDKNFSEAQKAAQRYLRIAKLSQRFITQLQKTTANLALHEIDTLYFQKDYLGVIALAKATLSQPPSQKLKSNPRRIPSLIAGVEAAAQIGKPELAEGFVTALLAESPYDQKLKQAILNLASAQESQLLVGAAADTLCRLFWRYRPVSDTALAQKLLVLSYLASLAHLDNALKAVCPQKNCPVSARFEALRAVLPLSPLPGAPISCMPEVRQELIKKMKATSVAQIQGIYAAGAFSCATSDSPLHERLQIARTLWTTFKAVDGDDQLVLLPLISTTMPDLLHSITQSLTNTGPLKIDKTAIAKRTEGINQAEAFFQEAEALPWLSLKITALVENAFVFSKMATDLQSLVVANDKSGLEQIITQVKAPFEAKAKSFNSDVVKACQENVFELKLLKKWLPVKGIGTLQDTPFVMLDVIQDSITTGPHNAIQSLWLESFKKAVQINYLPRLEFLVSAAEEKKLLAAQNVLRAKAALFIQAGALAEATSILKSGSDPTFSYFQSLSTCLAFDATACLPPLENFFALANSAETLNPYKRAFILNHWDDLIKSVNLSDDKYQKDLIAQLMKPAKGAE